MNMDSLLFIGHTAKDITDEHKVKTVKEEFVYQALEELGFDNYIGKTY